MLRSASQGHHVRCNITRLRPLNFLPRERGRANLYQIPKGVVVDGCITSTAMPKQSNSLALQSQAATRSTIHRHNTVMEAILLEVYARRSFSWRKHRRNLELACRHSLPRRCRAMKDGLGLTGDHRAECACSRNVEEKNTSIERSALLKFIPGGPGDGILCPMTGRSLLERPLGCRAQGGMSVAFGTSGICSGPSKMPLR